MLYMENLEYKMNKIKWQCMAMYNEILITNLHSQKIKKLNLHWKDSECSMGL